jgi:predicted ester cyclase
MSVEQVARDFISNMSDSKKVQAMLAPGAMASGGVLPQAIPMMEAMNVIAGLTTAFPDLKIDIRQVISNGNQATVKVQLGGTQTGALSLPMPGFKPVPPSGKKVSVKDAYLVSVVGDKVSHMKVDSPADGGIPAILAQLDVKMPAM